MSSDNYLGRLKNFWFPDRPSLLWFLLSLPPLYFFQTLVHEGSHALSAFVAAGTLPKFAPFPHASPDLRFLNGATLSGDGLIQAPQLVAVGLIVLLTLLFIPIRNRTARFLLHLWYFGASLDLLYNTAREVVGGHSQFADWSRFQDQYEISHPTMIALSALVWLIPLSHFLWVNLPPWRWDRVPRSSFWDYRTVASVYGLLSVCAIVLSVSVIVPKLIKTTGGFLIPFALQVLSLFWCLLYIVWSLVRRR